VHLLAQYRGGIIITRGVGERTSERKRGRERVVGPCQWLPMVPTGERIKRRRCRWKGVPELQRQIKRDEQESIELKIINACSWKFAFIHISTRDWFFEIYTLDAFHFYSHILRSKIYGLLSFFPLFNCSHSGNIKTLWLIWSTLRYDNYLMAFRREVDNKSTLRFTFSVLKARQFLRVPVRGNNWKLPTVSFHP